MGAVEFEAGRTFVRCSVCDKIASNEPPGRPCCRAGCPGTMRAWMGPIAEENLNALMAESRYAPPLHPEEHSAAVSDEKREEAETGLQQRERRLVRTCWPARRRWRWASTSATWRPWRCATFRPARPTTLSDRAGRAV